MEKLSSELKKGETFTIKGKRKKYTIEDIFTTYLSIIVYYRETAGRFGKLKLSKNEKVITF